MRKTWSLFAGEPLCERLINHLKLFWGISMAAHPTGGCRCGAVRYECTADFIAMSFCYCRDCQRLSGSAFGSFVLIPPGSMRLKQGQPRRYAAKTDSGRLMTREFCAECGSPLFAWTENIFAVTAASFDESSALQPSIAIWLDSAQPWAPIPLDLLRFSRNPPISSGG